MFTISDHKAVLEEMKQCKKCPLHEGRTKVVVGDYSRNSICFVGEGPGFNEDRIGKPFVGRSGKLLDEMLEKLGLSRSEVSVLNIVKCRPPENRTPTSFEMKVCGNTWLDIQLEYLKPAIIVPLGSTALKYFSPKSQITRDNAKLLEIGEYKLFPLFHPSYILRRGGDTDGKYFDSFEKLKEVARLPEKEGEKQSKLEDFFS